MIHNFTDNHDISPEDKAIYEDMEAFREFRKFLNTKNEDSEGEEELSLFDYTSTLRSGESEDDVIIDGVYYSADKKDLLYYDCDIKATEFNVPYFVKRIRKRAFENCDYLRKVIIGENVEEIEPYAFCYCTALNSIVIPSSIKRIGDSAFCGCYGLAEVYNLSSLPIKAQSDSYGCVALNALDVFNHLSAPSKLIDDKNGFVLHKKGLCVTLVGYLGTENDIIIPRHVKVLADGCFSNSCIRSVTLAPSVTKIGKHAFYDCRRLENVTFNKRLKEIDACAFEGCLLLKEVSLPNSVVAIGGGAFFKCPSLRGTLRLPSSLRFLGKCAFSFCRLSGYDISKTNRYFNVVDGVLYSKDMSRLLLYPSDCNKSECVIPSSVEVIGYNAFENAAYLGSIFLPSRLKRIEEFAFARACNVKKLVIPENVEFIGANSFVSCTALNTVEFEDKRHWYITQKIGPITAENVYNHSFLRGICVEDIERLVRYVLNPIEDYELIKLNVKEH